jgi:hypothetical protein
MVLRMVVSSTWMRDRVSSTVRLNLATEKDIYTLRIFCNRKLNFVGLFRVRVIPK